MRRDCLRMAWRDESASHARHLMPWRSSTSDRMLLAVTTVDNQPALLGATFYAGAKHSASMWRIMVKSIDQQNVAAGTRKNLSEEEHRVRIEVTLDFRELQRLGLTTLAELSAFRFQTFQCEYFKFTLPPFRDPKSPDNARHSTKAIEACRRVKFLRAGVVGLREMDKAFVLGHEKGRAKMRGRLGIKLAPRKRTGRGNSSTLVSYEALTRRVVTALRHLGKRMDCKECHAVRPQPRVDSSSALVSIDELE